MCSYVPANVGESGEGQVYSQKDIKAAIDASIEAELPKRTKRSLAEQKKRTSWLGADADIDEDRPKSVLANCLLAVNRLWYGRRKPKTVVNRSFFFDCERDEKGYCLPRGTAKAGFSSPKEMTKAFERAKRKIDDAPVPDAKAVKKARKELKLAAQGKIRAGGEARGGSAKDRARQRYNLFKEFGGEEMGYVVCPWTGLKMHWTDDPKLNPKGYPKFERGKVFTKKQGGGYQLANLIPESFAANRARNNVPARRENLN